MKSTFYIYTVKDSFIKIDVNTLKLSKTKDIEMAGYFTSKKNALSWSHSIHSKYPYAILKEAKLTIK